MKFLNRLPQLSDKRIAIHVKPAAERSLRQGHPWVFDQSIRKQSHDGQAGDLAVIFDDKRRFLAIGLYDPGSPIRVKVLQHHTSATINQDWFTTKLEEARQIRSPLPQHGTTGYRLIYGEGDSLPSLIIDRYADTLVMKLYSMAWLPHLRGILTALENVHPFERLVLRLSRNIQPAVHSYGLFDGQILIGDALTEPIVFQENGLHFSADVVQGHKTGFFFDQRDNRARVREFAQDKRVLDVFAYNGGFSVYAAAGGATEVTSLDSSRQALASAQQNFLLNHDTTNIRNAKHHIIEDDAFSTLEKLHDTRQQYDLIIVDPPSFAKRAEEVKPALQVYRRLASLALNLLTKNGILIMCSCSSRVTTEQFSTTIRNSIDASGRNPIDIQYFGHALDHPVTFPEGEYLKCMVVHF